MSRYSYQAFDVKTPPELGGDGIALDVYPVAIIGAGPVGLTAALDLATRGIRSVVLDDNNVVSIGSRAICWAKRTLEIFDRLGVGERMLDKGVTWKVGRLFHGDEEVYNFNLLPEAGHKYPAFINLQQYYVEQFLVERCHDFPELIDLRFRNKVISHQDSHESITLAVETPDGNYPLRASHVLACDGAGSPTRKRMNLPFEGQVFDEHFLIADVEMKTSPFETDEPERWFWFEPEFHAGQSALLHKQPDNIYRIDLQLGPNTDPTSEATEEKVTPRIKAMVGDTPFTFDWLSVYKFRCASLREFIHGRMIFVGDSAHVVSPFGARGGNGGIQDVDNLCWKLAMVINGEASINLLSTYNDERGHGAKENILNSSRATNFMTPKSPIEHLFRNEVLRLARHTTFAQKLINSGRLSVPCSLADQALQTPGTAQLPVGSALIDAPVSSETGNSWLVRELQGRFVLLGIGNIDLPDVDKLRRVGIEQNVAAYSQFKDTSGLIRERYGQDCAYLLRPDAHIAASFCGAVTADEIRAALQRASGHELTSTQKDASHIENIERD